MTAKEFLQKGRKMNFELNELIRARDKAFAKACASAVDYTGEHVQTSPGNVTESKFVNYADYAAALDKSIDELYAYQTKMLNLINTVDNTVHRAILIAWYINCDTWESIADRFNYDLRWTRRLHGRALCEIPYKAFVSIIHEQNLNKPSKALESHY